MTTDGAARVIVGRQSICRADRTVVGYELLFRGVLGVGGRGDRPTGDAMTAEVVYSAQVLGLDQLADGHDLFLNADRGLLVGEVPLLLPPDRTVVEVLETVPVDAEVVAGCRRLVAAGYRLALDDFVWSPAAAPLLELATVVKVDVVTATPAQVEEVLARCRDLDVELLAEKVEDDRQLAPLAAQGFTLFQGYALEQPVTLSGRVLEADVGRLHAATSLLAGGDDDDVDALDRVLRRDPGLAVQVVQLAALGRPGETRREVRSVRDAVVLAGTRRVRNWMALLLLRGHRAASPATALTALVRARACELVADRVARPDRDLAFAAGLLSSLDALLGVPLPAVRATLGVEGALAGAAFDHAGPVGWVVGAVTARQLGRRPGGGPRPAPVGTHRDPDVRPLAPAGVLDACLADALVWALNAVHQLGAA